MNAFLQSARNFHREDEGAQIIEYALIVAVVSLALILGLQGLAGTDFTAWITKVGTCLKTGTCPTT
ncbi:Flp family type IVb pilin [Variovorax soli]|jgi:pilus assembly protein Flp/PilA|uniref:Flp family type IVb pilin n=1 Tax=Variovorax soli TaxID=376815 RepID=UPI000839A5EB|nr:Flp family type IVb pilin [Variovorax soli]